VFLSKVLNSLRLLAAASRRSPNETLLAERFAHLAQKRIPPKPDAPMVTIGAPPDIAYYAILGEIVSGLRVHRALRTEQIYTQALRPGASQSLRHFLRARLDYNFLSERKWEVLYNLFCDRLGYRTTAWANPLRALRQWHIAWRLWRGPRDIEQLAALSLDGILIGDLVIDTYLRLGPTASIALRDRYLLAVIRQAVKDVDLAFRYFRRSRPSLYLCIYTTYLSHGVPARVALACGVRVISFGNLQEFGTEISAARPQHTKDSSRYSTNFAALPDRAAKSARAAQAMKSRLSGQIDPATAYMKKSAYAVTNGKVPNVRGATIVFLHDFYDSAHVYSWLLFHDFWEWTCFTIETLQAAGRDFWIKPHPNQGAESNSEVARLKSRYPNVKFLSSDITNLQLADAGMACAVTIYGSVAPEVAFLGVPSISAGDSPHASFDAFCLGRTRDTYAALLLNPPLIDVARLKAQAVAFYHMHNLDLEGDRALLRDRFAAVWAHMAAPGAATCLDKDKVANVLAALTDTPAFQHFADILVSDTLP
jgi:hypothetical protein